jgi:microcystin-dependent protein
MAQPYVGEIRIFAGNFAPAGWMFCDGSLLSISENETLFQLIGTTYGGDGQSTFALPDMRGRLPLHQGAGASLSARILAENGGVEQVTLTQAQVPAHSHPFIASSAVANSTSPQAALPAKPVASIYNSGTSPAGMAAGSITPTGGNQPHSNLQPYLCVNYIISLYGIFPSPS